MEGKLLFQTRTQDVAIPDTHQMVCTVFKRPAGLAARLEGEAKWPGWLYHSAF
ncbi:hypothetical protein RGAI101_3802 [Roseobacter sp. GAI101]|nr:hypothetical protein RGAI101_3802 [Roseobacter sp. GAI101]